MHEEVRFSTVDTVSTFSRNILMCGCVGCKHKMRKSVFQPVPGSPFISRPLKTVTYSQLKKRRENRDFVLTNTTEDISIFLGIFFSVKYCKNSA
jgi:hypothetical protein